MVFSNRLAKHSLKMLAQLSLRDVAFARNKYLIVTSDAFLPQSKAFKRTVSVGRCVLQLLLWKKILWAMRWFFKLAKFSTNNNWSMNDRV